MRLAFPPRRTLLPYTRELRASPGKVYERLTHKNSDTPAVADPFAWGTVETICGQHFMHVILPRRAPELSLVSELRLGLRQEPLSGL
jgi:hypothetical protein